MIVKIISLTITNAHILNIIIIQFRVIIVKLTVTVVETCYYS